MNYPPKHHQDNDLNHVIEVIKSYPLATIISVKDVEPLVTHLPLIYREDGKLIGHIDIFNPQAELLRLMLGRLIKEVRLHGPVHGPSCYSPGKSAEFKLRPISESSLK